MGFIREQTGDSGSFPLGISAVRSNICLNACFSQGYLSLVDDFRLGASVAALLRFVVKQEARIEPPSKVQHSINIRWIELHVMSIFFLVDLGRSFARRFVNEISLSVVNFSI
jgi:hypothetical protein